MYRLFSIDVYLLSGDAVFASHFLSVVSQEKWIFKWSGHAYIIFVLWSEKKNVRNGKSSDIFISVIEAHSYRVDGVGQVVYLKVISLGHSALTRSL